MRPLLEIKEVHQSFRVGFWMKRVDVLRGVSLKVPERSVFGFLGANGAGKTTLIHLMAGLRRPVSGSLALDGEDVRSRRARARVGYLPERPYFHEHLTGESLLRYFGALSGMSNRELALRIPKILRQVNLVDAADLELKRYSKGMLQRIGIAQAVLHDPDFLLLDEPMSGLDPLGRKEIRELIQQLASEGKTIFFSSHVIPDVEAICDRVAVISGGRIVREGPISSFLGGENSQTEVTVSGLSQAATSQLPGVVEVRGLPEGVRLIIRSGAELNQLLTALITLGGKIETVVPIRHSLEELFGEVGRS